MRTPSAMPMRRVGGSILGAPRYPGERVSYVADATNGVEWVFEHSGDGSAYQWRAVGPSALSAEVTTNEGLTNAAYAALATAGPSLTLPLAGDWDIGVEAHIVTGNAAGCEGFMSYDVGATGAIDTDAASLSSTVTAGDRLLGSPAHERRKTAIAAGTAIVSKYKSAAASTAFSNRRLWARPVRCA